jgi:hypothetical protein
MKTSRSLFVVGAFVVSFSTAFGQGDYAFKVLANKGTNEVKSGNTWVAVKTGAALKKEDELKLAENSYVGLVSSGGKPLELKASGSYKVAELLNQVGNGASVLNKYTDFLLSSNSAEAKKNRLSATGAVHRGLDMKLYLPENNNADVLNNIVILNWEAKHGPYIVTLKNMFDEQLGMIETPETTASVDLSAKEYAGESAILIEVMSKGDGKLKSLQHLVKRMNAAQTEKVRKELTDEMGTNVNDETALNKLILAGFYEQHKLYIDALTAYQQAIKLAPDVPSYKEDYDDFLIRNGFKTVAP